MLQRATVPQLSDSLTETRTYTQISIVSNGLDSSWGSWFHAELL